MALSYSFMFAFHHLKPTEREVSDFLSRIKHLFEVMTMYSLSYILLEVTKANSEKKNAYEKQFEVLVSKKELPNYKYTP